MTAAEQRQSTLQAELTRLDGKQPPGLQLTPAALDRHLQGLTAKLRSGAHGKVREAIQQSVARILVSNSGSLTIVLKLSGLLGVEAVYAQLAALGNDGPMIQQVIASPSDRQWNVISELKAS